MQGKNVGSYGSGDPQTICRSCRRSGDPRSLIHWEYRMDGLVVGMQSMMGGTSAVFWK